MEIEVTPRSTEAEYNLVLRRRARWQFILAVVLPVVLTLVLIIAVTALAAWPGDPQLGAVAQMATMCLLAPLMCMSIGMTALLGVAAFGVVKLTGKLPPLFFKVYHALTVASQTVERVSKTAAGPVVKINSGTAWLGGLRAGLGGSRSRGTRGPNP